MRHLLIVLGICLAAIAVGALLYVYGPKELQQAPVISDDTQILVEQTDTVPFTVIAEDTYANAVAERKNYAVYDEAEFQRLWTMAYGSAAPVLPPVDFEKDYVVGVFAGEKASGGYGIRVADITDSGNARTIGIDLIRPGAGCVTSQAITRPFQFVSVPLSEHALSRKDREVVTACQ